MAKINNFELKNFTDFLGHEGEPLGQGDIYYKGKKVGWYSQDAHGGEDNIDFNRELSSDLIMEMQKILGSYKCDSLFPMEIDGIDKTYDFRGGEYLFADLMTLRDDEKRYKKYCKEFTKKSGRDITSIALIQVNFYDLRVLGGIDKTELEKRISIVDNGALKDKKYRIYTSLNDFIKVVE